MPATKEQIADAFERHVARFGYAKATVEEVAAELGISKKTIYEHFSSKQALYLYIIERSASLWRGEMRQLIADVPTAAKKFEVLMLYVLGGSREHIVETTNTEWQQEYEIVGKALVKAVGEIVDEIIEMGVASGEFSFPDPKLAERLLGAVSLEYTLAMREDVKVDADVEVVAAMLRFLGAK